MSDAEPEISGDVVAVGLILSLIFFLLLFFSVVGYFLDAEDLGVLFAPFVRLLHSASFGICALAAFGSYKRGRSHWWVWAAFGLVPIVQWGMAILWFVRGRKSELSLGRLSF